MHVFYSINLGKAKAKTFYISSSFIYFIILIAYVAMITSTSGKPLFLSIKFRARGNGRVISNDVMMV